MASASTDEPQSSTTTDAPIAAAHSNAGDGGACCIACAQPSAGYTCPRCNAAYCSLACYKAEAHRRCSERFYERCVRQELEERGGQTLKGAKGEGSAVPDLGELTANDDGSEHSDCEDEEDGGDRPSDSQYIARVLADTADGAEGADESQVDAGLTAGGVGALSVEALLASLNVKERQAFEQLVAQMGLGEEGRDSDEDESVFRKKGKK